MKLAFITPTRYLEKFSKQGDIYLALAHLIEEGPSGLNTYGRFHRSEAAKSRQVILDNGLFEGAQVGIPLLLRRAELIGADTVCAPDVLYDSVETIKAFKKFVKAKRDYGLVARVMGIPQADNPSDWWECFRFMQLSDECDIIGLSILSVPKAFESSITGCGITQSRVYLLQQLIAFQSVLGHPLKPIHLLGLGESYADVIYAQRHLPHTVVSNDSSSAFVHGLHGVRYKRFGIWDGGKITEKLNFSIDEITLNQTHNIQHNINIAKEIRSWNAA